MSELVINTTQNVNISFTAASVGERILAYFIDLLIKTGYAIVIFYVVFVFFGFDSFVQSLDNSSQFAIIILFLLPYIFYTLVMESMMDGQTFGKRIMKIKVVKIDGYQASFGDYLIRWFMRIVDVNSNSGLVGLISMVASPRVQRLGDMAAGTAVITLKNNISINHTIVENIDDSYVPVYPLVIRLSDNDMRIIKETYQRSVASRDYAMLIKLRKKIEEVTGIKNQSGSDTDFIKTVLKDYSFYTQSM